MKNDGVGLREPRAQRWRALAIFGDGAETLLCLGSSIVQIRNQYLVPWYELLSEDVRRKIVDIEIQKWSGAADQGRWEPQSSLIIPPARQPK